MKSRFTKEQKIKQVFDSFLDMAAQEARDNYESLVVDLPCSAEDVSPIENLMGMALAFCINSTSWAGSEGRLNLFVQDNADSFDELSGARCVRHGIFIWHQVAV